MNPNRQVAIMENLIKLLQQDDDNKLCSIVLNNSWCTHAETKWQCVDCPLHVPNAKNIPDYEGIGVNIIRNQILPLVKSANLIGVTDGSQNSE